MDFGEILSKAWKIIWKHKILWLFGILASCGTINGMNAGGGGSGSGMQASGQSNLWNGETFLTPSAQRGLTRFFQNLTEVPPGVWVSIGLLAFFILIGFVLIVSLLRLFLGTLGTVGMVKGTSIADQSGDDTKPLSFGKLFTSLKPYYWKVFLFDLGYRVLGFVFVLFLLIPIILFMAVTCGLGALLIIPISWLIHQMLIFTTIAIVEEDLDIFDAIPRAWRLITGKLGNVILMSLILGIGQVIIGLMIGLPLFAIPFLPILITLLTTQGMINLTGLIISLVLFLIFIPVLVLFSGVLRAYVLTAWTLTYRRIVHAEDLALEVLTADEGSMQD